MISSSTTEATIQDDIRNKVLGIQTLYRPEVKTIGELSHTVLLVHSWIEEQLEELIIAYLEGWVGRVSLDVLVKAIFRYQPIFNRMFYLGKLKACREYGYFEGGRKDRLLKLLSAINDLRDQFAHYQCYKYVLEKKFESTSSRIKVLKDLGNAMELLEEKRKHKWSKSLG